MRNPTFLSRVSIAAMSSRSRYSNSARTLAAVLTAAALAGCVVAPVRPVRAAYVAPPHVAYIAPAYAMPAPGYAWEYHANFGWGWHHPVYGWHRGWR